MIKLNSECLTTLLEVYRILTVNFSENSSKDSEIIIIKIHVYKYFNGQKFTENFKR